VRRLRPLLVVLAVAALAPACSAEGMAFREDRRVDIVEPSDRAEVRLPVRLRWTAEDAGPYFAVFVDRAPVRPGQSLRAVTDESCSRTPGCPDAAYLRDRHVYLTEGHSLRLDTLPPPGTSQRTGAKDRHEATIVLIDRDGRRMGEAAYTVEFTVEDGEDS
jgi:hypothetical protein